MMYHKERYFTYGENKIILICRDGMGIENFRILNRTEEWVDVGYTLKPVRCTVIREFSFSPRVRECMISEAYYLVDCATGKIRRLHWVGLGTCMPHHFKKMGIIFGPFEDVYYELQKVDGGNKVVAYSASGLNNIRSFKRAVKDNDGLNAFYFTVLDFGNQHSEKVNKILFCN